MRPDHAEMLLPVVYFLLQQHPVPNLYTWLCTTAAATLRSTQTILRLAAGRIFKNP
jgi:hypothetical protein